MSDPLNLILALLVKHFVFDFLWQPKWMWANKGKFGHWGGIAHAGAHAFGTLIVVRFFAPLEVTAIAAGIEFIVHYAVDWAKMNINARAGWGANTHEQFWQLLGLDQLLHNMTYVWIVWLVFHG